jgi:hypothetical protein
MKTSENVNEIASALAKAQGEMLPAVKDAANPFFKSKYSDLKSVSDVIKDPLQKNGLSVLQDTTTMEKSVSVTTMIMHSSGQWIQFSPMTLPISKADIQGFGSAITYARRYALCSALCIVSSEDRDLDDDGNSHMTNSPPQRPMLKKEKETISKEEFTRLDRVLNMTPHEYQEKFMNDVQKYYGRRDLMSIPAKNFSAHLSKVEEKLKSMEPELALQSH